MSIKEKLSQELDSMSEAEVERVAEYVAFLKFRARRKPALDEARLTVLYAEFADEDRQLAEEGMADYINGLTQEDSR